MKYTIKDLETNKATAQQFIEELHSNDRFNKFTKNYLNNDGTLSFNKFFNDFDKLDTSRDTEQVEPTNISSKDNKIIICSIAYAHVEIDYGTQVRLYGEENEVARPLDIDDEDFEELKKKIEDNPWNVKDLVNETYDNNNCELCESGFGNYESIEII